jgi:hypothetical protein
MPDEDLIRVRLQPRVAESLQVGVVESLPVLAAAGQIDTIVHVLLEQGGEIELILLLRYLFIAMPIEDAVETDLILAT